MAFGDPRIMPGRYAPVSVFDRRWEPLGHVDCSIVAIAGSGPQPDLIVAIHAHEWSGQGPDPLAPEGRFWLVFSPGFALGGEFTPGLHSFIANEVRARP